MPERIDSIQETPYAIGYSFRNPQVVKPVTHRKARPYFAYDWAAQGPTDVKRDLYQSGQLKRFPTTWRRAAKTMAIEKLGDGVTNRKELPSFDELGEAPGATDTVSSTSTVERGWWGMLDNAITTAGSIINQRQQVEIDRKQAAAQAAQMSPTYLPSFFTPQDGESMSLPTMLMIAGGMGLAAYLYMKR